MPLDIRTIEDAWLGATADFQRWRAEWEQQYFGPLMLTQARALWSSLTPQQHALLKQQVGPDEYKKLEAYVKGG